MLPLSADFPFDDDEIGNEEDALFDWAECLGFEACGDGAVAGGLDPGKAGISEQTFY